MTVSRQQMRPIAKMLARIPLAERRNVPGIGLRRAEIVIAGAAVFCGVAGALQAFRVFRYSPLGLRDGLLADGR